ncbi:uncharacterized protein EI97DRAFT_216443 [Westerdykella ornata]|uniref:Uncharacterized protein n=1 Tax=Westerdykella ornata TaxID=318751 RepID=A0A6A6JSF7_WESOR|nr:uncharacterized protein EI97DRAFT_216443 [Westerdykella ornata]KAF2278666.1 hypothetical protein EI97DRAFT_216443 [Westerdykella ornata]
MHKTLGTGFVRRVMYDTHDEMTSTLSTELVRWVPSDTHEEMEQRRRFEKAPEVRIVKYVESHISDITLLERRVRGIQNVISRQVEQLEQLEQLARIRVKHMFNRAAHLIRRTDELLSEATLAASQYRRAWIKRLISSTKHVQRRSEAETYELQAELLKIFISISALSPEILNTEIDSISRRIYQAQDDVNAVLSGINFRAKLAAATNNSAIDVYFLHTILRKRLNDSARRRLTVRGNRRTILNKLNELARRRMMLNKLDELGQFNNNLFVYFKAPTPSFIKDKLEKLQVRLTAKEADRQLRGMGGEIRSVDELLQDEGPPIYWDGRRIRRVGYMPDRRIIYYRSTPPAMDTQMGAELERGRGQLGKIGGEKQRKRSVRMRKREAKKELWEEISSWLS